jgi:NAD(P)-dependent dehydrogenase (short-subunit alcohol dehydrogenase family)
MDGEQGKVAIVTGAARGIGAAAVERLSRDGWRVAAADIDGPAAEATARANGGLGVACDVGCETDIHRLVDDVLAGYGRIDAIVSNAGINLHEPLGKLSLETWNRVLAVNLTAAFLLARASEQALRAARGAMVLIASTRAHMSEPDTLPYSASKGGLVALTHALAIALAPDVRVNCISPGWIDTGKWGPLTSADHAQHPVGRAGRPQDVAGAVAYLLSEDADFITGAELILDGGMTRKMIYV